MKTALILFLTFCCIYCKAQTSADLQKQIDELTKQKKWSTAVPLAETQVQLVLKEVGENNSTYLDALYQLALLYSRTRKEFEAERLLKQILSIRKKLDGENHPRYLESLNALGNFYIDTKKFVEANFIFSSGLAIAKKLYGDESSDYDYFLFNVGYIADVLNNKTQADSIYNLILVLRKKKYGDNSRQYALALNNRGSIKNDLREYDAAKIFLKQAVKIRKEILGENNPDYWQSVNNLAKAYMKNMQPDSAQELYLKAHAWYEKNKDVSPRNYALSLHRIATLYTDMPGKKRDALVCFAKALPLIKETMGPNEMYIDDIVITGNIYKFLGEYSNAENQYRQAFQTMLTKPNEKPEFFAKAMNLMARFYKEYGIYNKADSFFKASTAFYKNAFTENSVQYANALTGEASLYIVAGEYTNAEPILLQSLNIINTISGKRNLSYFTTLLNLMVVIKNYRNGKKQFNLEPKRWN